MPGLLFFVPSVMLLPGATRSALSGKLGKRGVNDQSRSQVQDMLKPGAAAVGIMPEKIPEDKFADATGPFGGRVPKTGLSEEDEKERERTRRGLDHAGPVAQAHLTAPAAFWI